MNVSLLNLTIKDGLIAVTLIILLLCILEIRKLKKSLAEEIQKRILPQLILEFRLNPKKYPEDSGFFLLNESYFLARDIQFEDVELNLLDLGYHLHFILKFDNIEHLKPQEKVQLNFQVLDKERKFLPEVTKTMIPRLVEASFKVPVRYANIENLKCFALYAKKGKKIAVEKLRIGTAAQ